MNDRKRLIATILCPISIVICSIGVLLPWNARNAYLIVLAKFLDIVLDLDFFVEFFMDVGFISSTPSNQS